MRKHWVDYLPGEWYDWAILSASAFITALVYWLA